jgi:tetratricopeptide (TPR) repeat protein
MRFINIYRYCRLLPALVLLVACSNVGKDTPSIRETNTHEKTMKELSYGVNVEHLFFKPNRYLDYKKSVSTATRKSFELALKEKELGQLEKAETAFIELTVREPGLSGPWVQLGDIAKERAQHATTIKQREQLLEKAAAQYHQALLINPHNYHGHNRLAMVYRQQGQFAMALTHYQNAIDSWPAFALAYKNRGILYDLYLGDKAKALRDYQVFLALNESKSLADADLAKRPSFVKQQRKIKGWVADLARQVQQEETQAEQQPEVANNAW